MAQSDDLRYFRQSTALDGRDMCFQRSAFGVAESYSRVAQRASRRCHAMATAIDDHYVFALVDDED